jgi:predicted PolB exonuclease-like 3'-5' exonuclease
MGMNGHGAQRIVVDIETFPIDNAADYLNLSDISAPANWKDPEKIAAYCKEKQTELVSKTALDLDLCRIVAIGYLAEDDSGEDAEVLICRDEAMEEACLMRFWAELDERTTITYNGLGFDLPILQRRSLYLNVPAPILNLDKYRSPHIDLQQRLSLNGTKTYRKLSWYAKRFGLDVPADSTTGKDIGAMVTAGDWAGIAAHCRADVLTTHALAVRMGFVVQQGSVVS